MAMDKWKQSDGQAQACRCLYCYFVYKFFFKKASHTLGIWHSKEPSHGGIISSWPTCAPGTRVLNRKSCREPEQKQNFFLPSSFDTWMWGLLEWDTFRPQLTVHQSQCREGGWQDTWAPGLKCEASCSHLPSSLYLRHSPIIHPSAAYEAKTPSQNMQVCWTRLPEAESVRRGKVLQALQRGSRVCAEWQQQYLHCPSLGLKRSCSAPKAGTETAQTPGPALSLMPEDPTPLQCHPVAWPCPGSCHCLSSTCRSSRSQWQIAAVKQGCSWTQTLSSAPKMNWKHLAALLLVGNDAAPSQAQMWFYIPAAVLVGVSTPETSAIGNQRHDTYMIF